MVCFGVVLSASVHLVWDSLCFLDLYVYFLRETSKLFKNIFSNVFNLMLFLFSFWLPYDVHVGVFEVVPEAPYPILVLFKKKKKILFIFRQRGREGE